MEFFAHLSSVLAPKYAKLPDSDVEWAKEIAEKVSEKEQKAKIKKLLSESFKFTLTVEDKNPESYKNIIEPITGLRCSHVIGENQSQAFIPVENKTGDMAKLVKLVGPDRGTSKRTNTSTNPVTFHYFTSDHVTWDRFTSDDAEDSIDTDKGQFLFSDKQFNRYDEETDISPLPRPEIKAFQFTDKRLR